MRWNPFNLLGGGDKPGNAVKRRNKSSFVAKSGSELLKQHKKTLDSIYECTGVSEKIWKDCFIKMFENGASLMQEFPASAAHHHSERGGLLSHSLELALYCAREKRGTQYTSNNREDEANKLREVFGYACISAAFMHDIGKLFIDIDVYDINLSAIWYPSSGSIPEGHEYTFKWNKGEHRSRRDHEQAQGIFVTHVIPEKGMRWLKSYDDSLFRKWISSVTGHGEGFGGEVYDAVHVADIHSAKMNLVNNPLTARSEQNTGTSLSTSALIESNPANEKNVQRYYHEPFIQHWSDALHNGSYKLNTAGASAWVLNEVVILVAPKLLVEAMNVINSSKRSLNQGGVTQDIQATMRQLIDCNALTNFELNGPYMVELSISEPTFKGGKGWNSTLKFIAISRSLLDPSSSLPNFNGVVTSPTTGEIIHDGINTKSGQESETIAPPDIRKDSDGMFSTGEVVRDISKLADNALSTRPPLSPSIAILNESQISASEDMQLNSHLEEMLARPDPRDLPIEPETSDEKFAEPGTGLGFWYWLQAETISKGYEMNKHNAPVHIVSLGEGAQAFLVSPAIFLDYLVSEKIVKSKFSKNNDIAIKKTTKSFLKIKKNQSMYGQDIFSVNVSKKSSRNGISKLYGVLLSVQATKDLFGEDYLGLRPNSAIQIKGN